MTRTTLFAAAIAAITAMPAAAGGIPALNLPNLTWPETETEVPDVSVSKGCIDATTIAGPACVPAGN